MTLYDCDGRAVKLTDLCGAVTSVLWEQNYTALNVFVSGLQIITGKQHTDQEADLRARIDRALGP